MSRSWTDELQVVLAPSKVTLTRVARVLTLRGVIRTPREPAVHGVAGGTGGRWRAALDTLGQALAGISRPLGAVTVHLSHTLVRHAVVPWSDALAGAREQEAYARQCFVDLYGDLAQTWVLRLSPCRIGAPRLASAVDAELLAALRDTLVQAGLELRSIQPLLMATCNRRRTHLRRRSAWIVLPHDDVVCLGLLVGGDWARIRSLRVDAPWRQALPVLLDREALLVDGEPPREVVVLTEAGDDGDVAGMPPWQVEVLAPAVLRSDGGPPLAAAAGG